MSLFFFTVHKPSDSLSKYFLALGAVSSMWLGGTPSTSTILFIWSTCRSTGEGGEDNIPGRLAGIARYRYMGSNSLNAQTTCTSLWTGASLCVSAVYLIGSTEQGLSCMHLHQDAAKRPHIDGQVVGHP